MEEISNARTLSTKTFDLNDGQFRLDSHLGHIHYFDKLDSGRFREIDFKLSFDDIKRGWTFSYHSFRPFLPEYADEWVEFRDLFDDKDQVIKYKAVCSHILGRLVNPKEIGLKEGVVNCIIYDDAFGKGIDYILYFTTSALKKVVRIREGFKESNDMTFDFEIEFPKGMTNKTVDIIRANSKSEILDTSKAYALDITREKVFDTPKQTLIGVDAKDGKEWFTYLRSFKCWDDENVESINVDFIVKEDKTFLRKIIPLSFIEVSKGDIFTDTTTSYYIGSADGGVWASGANFGDARSSANGSVNSGTAYSYIACYLQSSSYNFRRMFLPVNTSGLTSGATITSASLFLCNFYAGDPAGSIAVIQTTQASPGSLTGTDYSALVLDYPDEACTRFNPYVSGWERYTYHEFPFNATGIGFIQKTDWTLLGCRIGTYDVDNVAPGAGANYHLIYMSEQAGSEPYLSVTYTTGGTTTTPISFNDGFCCVNYEV